MVNGMLDKILQSLATNAAVDAAKKPEFWRFLFATLIFAALLVVFLMAIVVAPLELLVGLVLRRNSDGSSDVGLGPVTNALFRTQKWLIVRSKSWKLNE